MQPRMPATRAPAVHPNPPPRQAPVAVQPQVRTPARAVSPPLPPPPAARSGGAILQQKKIPNLGSRVIERQAPRLLLQRQPDETYWLREEETQLPIRPSGLYNFVRVEEKGPVHLSKIDGHPALADGQPVEYAGEVVFDAGRMRFWSNASGNYLPRIDLHDQAGLPDDKFLTHEEVLRGKGRERPERGDSRPVPAERHAAEVAATRSAGMPSRPTTRVDRAR